MRYPRGTSAVFTGLGLVGVFLGLGALMEWHDVWAFVGFFGGGVASMVAALHFIAYED